jgi:hypothetical protein
MAIEWGELKKKIDAQLEDNQLIDVLFCYDMKLDEPIVVNVHPLLGDGKPLFIVANREMAGKIGA